MKKYVSILLILMFIFCFVGCEDSSDNTTPTDNAPTTTIDPDTVDFGYNSETEEYDRWYLQGTDDVVYVYFSDDNAEGLEEFVCRYNLVKSGVVNISTPLSDSGNNHLTTPTTFSLYVDIVFEDYFTVYDYATGNRYSRGKADEYNANFSDKIYTSEDELCAITFNSDFTCAKSDKENTVTGTWEVTSTHTVVCTFDGSKISYTINYYDDFSVKSIENGDEVFYTEASEDETVNKYKAY